VLRLFVAFATMLLALAIARPSGAEDVAVPIGLQAELLAKVAAYDKNFTERAGDRAQVLILVRPGNADSERVAAHMQTALGGITHVGGLPHDETLVTWTNGAALAQQCKAKRAAILYITPGFAGDVGDIRAALDGVAVLSVAAVADYVPKGIVLGFDLVSGKPKLLVNLTQAKRQSVAFKAEVLKMMRVYE
jgi:hypothetical protein